MASTYSFAQTITIRTAGRLVEVRVQIVCRNTSDPYSVEIFGVNADGTPSKTRLASTTRQDPVPPVPPPEEGLPWAPRPLASPLTVTSGQRLALVVSGPATTMVCLFESAKADVYSGGTAFYGDESGTWSENPEDFAFETLVVR
jgi:hypothetical protein